MNIINPVTWLQEAIRPVIAEELDRALSGLREGAIDDRQTDDRRATEADEHHEEQSEHVDTNAREHDRADSNLAELPDRVANRDGRAWNRQNS